MIIEKFKDPVAVLARFESQGRLLPKEVQYIDSWIDANNLRCFQLMRAPSTDELQPWISGWEDLVDFEVVPVETSSDFWAALPR